MVPGNGDRVDVPATTDVEAFVRRGFALEQTDPDGAEGHYERALEMNPSHVGALLGRATIEYRRGELDRAAQDLDCVLELDEGNVQARRLRGLTFESLRLYDAAVRDYELVAATAPSADAFRNLGDAHVGMDALTEAEIDYTHALQFDAGYVSGFYGRACVRGQLRRFEEAIKDFDRVLELEPSHTAARRLRAYTYGSLGEIESALRDYDIVLDGAPDPETYAERAELHWMQSEMDLALDDFDHAVELAPEWTFLLQQRGHLLLATGDYERALDDLDRVIAEDATNVEARRLRGIAREALGRMNDALADYDAVVSAGPSADSLSNRAGTKFALMDSDGAETDYTSALELDGEHLAAYMGRGRVRGDRGDLEGAVRDFSAFLEREPENLEAHRLRGVALGLLGRHAEAASDHRAVAEKAPAPGAFCNLADSLVELDELDEARRLYERALDLDQNLVRALLGRGYVLALTNELERAQGVLSQALTLEPENPEARTLRGLVLESLGRAEEALADLDVAVRVAPTTVRLNRRASVLLALDRFDEAERDLARMLELDPDNADANVGLGRLFAVRADYLGAHEAFDAAIAIDPLNPEAYVGRGDAVAALGEYEQAVSDYDSALELRSGDAEALRRRSAARARIAGSFQERGLVGLAVETYVAALADLDQALEVAAADPALHAERAIILRLLGAFDYAVEAASDGLQHADNDENNALWLLGEQGDSLRAWGEELRLTDRLVESLKVLMTARQRLTDEEGVPAWLPELTGLTLMALGRHEEAVSELEQASRIDEPNLTALNGLGEALYKVGAYDRALEVFERLLELGDENPAISGWAQVGAGLARRALGDTAEARRVLDASLGPASVGDYVERGRRLAAFGEDELAGASLREAVARGPDVSSALNELAWYLVQHSASGERLEQARELAERAVAATTDLGERYGAADTLGWILYRLGRVEDALGQLAEANRLHPYDLAVRQHVAEVTAALATMA